MEDRVQRLLEQHLAPDEYRRLESLTRGWKQMPFYYDQDLEAFHVRDEWLHEAFSDPDSVDEATVDLLLKAAEILTEHRDQLDCQRLGEPPAQEEESAVTVEFAPAEMLAAAHLEELLEHTDYRFESRDLPGSYVITIRYRFRTEHEYISRK
ncbi:MAG TPA: hypothetical protein VIK93_09155, partial [Limnochordales bacterium]